MLTQKVYQALIIPMSLDEKIEFFQLLVGSGAIAAAAPQAAPVATDCLFHDQ